MFDRSSSESSCLPLDEHLLHGVSMHAEDKPLSGIIRKNNDHRNSYCRVSYLVRSFLNRPSIKRYEKSRWKNLTNELFIRTYVGFSVVAVLYVERYGQESSVGKNKNDYIPRGT